MRHVLQEDNRAVIDDGVDAGELAEQGDQDGHDQRFSECGIQQISALFGDGGTDGRRSLRAAACGPTICARKCSASCSRPFCTSQRGLSGMKSSVNKKAIEGRAAEANIHLQFDGPAPVSR